MQGHQNHNPFYLRVMDHSVVIWSYMVVWTEAARKGEGAPWYTGVLLGAERFMASWHKSEEEASKLREVNRAA